MTQQDDITQRVPTDDEIQALWDEACKDSPQAPGWNRHIRFARAVLSKLRAPVADTLSLEAALHMLVDKIVPGLDTGDLVHDAGRASAVLSGIMASATVTGYIAGIDAFRTGVGETSATFKTTAFGAPVADERAAFYINPSVIDQKTGRIGEHVKTALTWSNTKHHGWQVPVFLSPPLASAPVADAKDWRIDTSAGRPILVYKNCSVIEAEDAEYVLRLIAADRASAPVAGEAQPLGYVMKGREWPDQCYYPSSHKPTDIHNWTPVFDHAAPQASALDAEYSRGRADGFDAGHGAALEKAAAALEDHRKAGREWVPGSLWDTLSREAAARIRALKQPQAITDLVTHGISVERIAPADILAGGQQRAGDVSAEAHRAALLEVERVGIELAGRLHEAAMSLETISQIAGRPGKDMETMDDVRGYAHSRARAARAALSATQAEQGERDA